MKSLPSTERVSLRDVAKAVGVSHVTVSLALRGDLRISEARRNEIRSVAQRLGYRPDPMLSSLSAYRQRKRPVSITSTIAWLNQWENPKAILKFREFAAYWEGAKEAAEQSGYHLEEFVIDKSYSADRLQRILVTRNVRGILIPPHVSGLTLPNFDWSLFSLVRLGVSVVRPRAHVVTSDQARCAMMAYTNVHERGYERIGYVSTKMFERNTAGNFRGGFLSAQDEIVLLEEPARSEDKRTLRSWLKQEAPDAVITTAGHFASLLNALGLKVPQDIAVSALSVLDGKFDSGIDQNSFEIGRVALRTLAALIHQNERGIPQYCRRILVEGRWLQGSSLPERAKGV